MASPEKKTGMPHVASIKARIQTKESDVRTAICISSDSSIATAFVIDAAILAGNEQKG